MKISRSLQNGISFERTFKIERNVSRGGLRAIWFGRCRDFERTVTLLLKFDTANYLFAIEYGSKPQEEYQYDMSTGWNHRLPNELCRLDEQESSRPPAPAKGRVPLPLRKTTKDGSGSKARRRGGAA
jgi:hypothetical protein